MNRLMTVSFVTALLLLSASQCIGEETKPGPDYEQLKAMEWIIGDWEADWVVPQEGLLVTDDYAPGAKVRSTGSCFWMENKNYIGYKFRREIDGKLIHQGFEMVGVDPKSKKLVHWLFSTLGGNGTGKWSVKGKTWKLEWSGVTADGTNLEGISLLVPIDANTYTWEIKESKKNDKKGPATPLVTFRRVTKKPGPSAGEPAEDGKPSSPHYEKYRILETWIGDWTNSSEIDGAEFKGRFSCKWAPGKSCLTWTWVADGDTPELLEPRGYGIIGWDPIEGKIKETAYGENGLTYTTWFEVKDNALHGTRKTVLPNGDKFTETMVFTSHEDRIAIKNLDRRDAEGNQVPFLFPEHGEFLRAPKASTVHAKRGAAPECAEQCSREDFKEYCQMRQDRWLGDVTWVTNWPGFGKKGDKVTAYFEAKMVEDGNLMTTRFFGGAGSGTGITLYDAGAKQIKTMWATSSGSMSQVVAFKKNGQWFERGSGSLADGTKTGFTSMLTISEEGKTHTWTGGGTVGDEKTDDQRDVWRRAGK